MEVLYKRCCGIDIHKNMMVACIFTSVRKKEIRQFSTMTDIRTSAKNVETSTWAY